MSKPPDDNDDDRRPLRDALADALAQLNLGDEATVDAVANQVRDALQKLGDFSLDDLGIGGRDTNRPDLRVVPDEFTEERTDEVATVTLHEPDVRIRVISPDGTVRHAGSTPAPTNPWKGPGLEAEGQIHLALSDDAPWQTVFRGTGTATYRVLCVLGVLDVAVDGELVEQLHPGQSMDVQSGLIRVRRGSDALATGRYARV